MFERLEAMLLFITMINRDMHQDLKRKNVKKN